MGRRKFPGRFSSLLLSMLVLSPPAWAEPLRYLQIGTGPPGETHFHLGGLIASAVSSPPGQRSCGKGAVCGVPGLIAMANASQGSVDNVRDIGAGRLDAAVVQADIGLWAYQGRGPFDGHPLRALRSIARIGTDRLQVVTRKDGPLRSLKDLKGKRLSLGEKGSGTLIHARMLLSALNLRDKDVRIETMGVAEAADALAQGRLDAFIVLDAAPSPAVSALAARLPLALLPLSRTVQAALMKADPLLSSDPIPAGSYPGQDQPVPSLSVAVSLVASATLADDLAEGVVRILWDPVAGRPLRDGGMVPGRDPAAIAGTAGATADPALPLHPGAARIYALQDEGQD